RRRSGARLFFAHRQQRLRHAAALRDRDPAVGAQRGALLFDRIDRGVRAPASAETKGDVHRAWGGRMKLVQSRPEPGRGTPLVEMRAVSMTYELGDGGRLLALDRVGCAVAESQFCSIVGPSGCGKSTLLMLTAGLYRPSAGQVVIDGRQVNGPSH